MSNGSTPGGGLAEAMRVLRICGEVSFGLRWSSSAAIPATCGALMLVPDMRVRIGWDGLPGPAGRPPRAEDEVMLVPGAATSGLVLPSRVRPRLLELLGATVTWL